MKKRSRIKRNKRNLSARMTSASDYTICKSPQVA